MRSKLHMLFLAVIVASVSCLANTTCGLDGIAMDGGEELRRMQTGSHLADRTPRWTPDGRMLIVNIADAIYGVKTDGSSLFPVPKEPMGRQFSPVLSDDGKVGYINYEFIPRGLITNRDTSPHHRHVAVSSLDDSGEERWLKFPVDHNLPAGPVWMQSGNLLVYIMHSYSSPDLNCVVCAVNASGTVVSLGISDALLKYGLAFSPDGQRVAYHRSHRSVSRDLTQIVIRHVNAENPDLLTTRALPNLSRVAWSLDGQRLFFATTEGTDKNPGRTSVMTMALDGAIELVAEVNPPQVISAVQPSPDGGHLLLTSIHQVPVSVVITGESRIVDLCCAGSYPVWASWSPSGEYVAVLHTRHSTQDVLILIRPDGCDMRTLIRRNLDGSLAPVPKVELTQPNRESDEIPTKPTTCSLPDCAHT